MIWKRVLLTASLAVAAVAVAWGVRPRPAVAFTTDYQAVLLTNGSLYYGRLEGLGKPFPVLREVFYVQTGVDPETKRATNVLLKRGKEWHGPDRMILNASHILLVEPVGRNSKVAELIAQQQR